MSLTPCVRSLAALLVVAATLDAAPTRAADITTPLGSDVQLAALSGTYASVAPENWYGAYGTRTFSFDKGRWSLNFVFALDPGMSRKVFEFHTEGSYTVTGPSSSVVGAYEATFRETSKAVTLRIDTPEMLEAMRLTSYGLKLDQKVDISEAGCAGWRPVSVCPDDHDLLAIDAAGKVFFGVRPPDNDMCTPDKRPNALLPPVVKR